MRVVLTFEVPVSVTVDLDGDDHVVIGGPQVASVRVHDEMGGPYTEALIEGPLAMSVQKRHADRLTDLSYVHEGVRGSESWLLKLEGLDDDDTPAPVWQAIAVAGDSDWPAWDLG